MLSENGVNYTINGRPATRAKFRKLFIPMVTLATVVIIASIGLYVMTVVALWENNAGLAIATIAGILAIQLYSFVAERKWQTLTLTFGSLVRFAAVFLLIAGIWQHNWFMIIIAFLMSIRITINK